MSLQDPAAGLRYQMQQALAQQMMQGGDAQNPNQTVGSGNNERVVPMSPISGAAGAVNKILGAYMQNKLMDKLAPKPNMAAATNAAIGTGEGPATAQAVGKALGAQMPGNPLAGLPSVTGDPMKDWMLSKSNPDLFKAMSDRTAPTPGQKEFNDPAMHDLIQQKMQKDGMLEGGKDYFPAGAIGSAPAPQPSAVPIPSSPTGAIPASDPRSVFTADADARATPDSLLAGHLPPPPAGVPPAAIPSAPTPAQLNDSAELDRRKGLVSGDQKYLNETLLPAKDGAVAAKASISALQNAAAVANSSSITRTGPTGPARVEFVKHLNDFLSGTGGEPIRPDEIANADAINKIGLRLTANMTKMLGSREAAQIFTKIQEANPNWYMQPQTLTLVSNLINADNDTAIGRYKAGYEAATKPGGMAQDGVNAFDSKNPAGENVKKAFAASGMSGYDNPKDPSFSALPSGTKFYDLNPQSPTYGKQLVKH